MCVCEREIMIKYFCILYDFDLIYNQIFYYKITGYIYSYLRDHFEILYVHTPTHFFFSICYDLTWN